MSVSIIYRFYSTASNEILNGIQESLISSFQMNGYANFHFISGGAVFAWSSALLNFV